MTATSTTDIALTWAVLVTPGITGNVLELEGRDLVIVPSTARELYDAMLAYYPTRVNPGILRLSAPAVRP